MIKFDDIEQGSPEWHQMRKGVITGTTLKGLMGTPAAFEDAVYELLGERLQFGIEAELEYEAPMDRGKRLEDSAISAFEFETGLSVKRTGFVKDENNPTIANSPDGLIGEEEAIECKCPEGKNYMKSWMKIDFENWTWEYNQDIPKEYRWQVVQYFVVNPKLKKLYLVFFNPDIKIYPLHIITIEKGDLLEDIEKAITKQAKVVPGIEKILSTIIKL